MYHELAVAKAKEALGDIVEDLIAIAHDNSQMINDRLSAMHLLYVIATGQDAD